MKGLQHFKVSYSVPSKNFKLSLHLKNYQRFSDEHVILANSKSGIFSGMVERKE